MWAGKMIALSNQVYYVDEPFNPGRKHPDNPVDTWFLDPEFLEEKWQIKIKTWLDHVIYSPVSYFKYNIHHFLKRNRRQYLKYFFKNNSELIINTVKTFKRSSRPVLKDPIALFGLEWLESNYDAKIIVLIRHPAAFVSSTKIAGWDFGVPELKKQPDLIDKYFTTFKNEIEEYTIRGKSLIENNILAWNLFYTRVKQYMAKHKEWYFIKHEDLSLRPEIEFRKIYDFLNIPFTKSIQNKILKYSEGSRNDRIHRDSKRNILTWKNRLTPDEIAHIKRKTENVWKHYYGEQDW